MKARSIKPGLYKNRQLGNLDPLARILLTGLWLGADQNDQVADDPVSIKAQTLPYDDCDVDAFLNDLERAGFIQRLESETGRIIQFCANRKDMMS